MRNRYRSHGIFLICLSIVFLHPIFAQASERGTYAGYTANYYGMDYSELLSKQQFSFLKRSGKRSSSTTTERPHPYIPPKSNSRAPQSFEQEGSNSTGQLRSVRNARKYPLYRSLREQYFSRDTWEIGISLASTHAVTDVGVSRNLPVSDFFSYHSSNFSFGGGVYGRYVFNDWFSAGAALNMLRLSVSRPVSEIIRGTDVFSFENNLYEILSQAEFRLPSLAARPVDLYGFIGAGVFLNEVSIYDRFGRPMPLTADYSRVQPFIPIGAGVSLKVSRMLKIGYEFSWRNTIFHYLDGVKLDDSFDKYFLNSIRLGYLF
jgi:hypothetical protein